MTAKKLNALIISDSRGEKIIFDEDGREIVNLTKYYEMTNLLEELTNGTCPEEVDLAKALYSWANTLLENAPFKEWDNHFSIVKDRSIYSPKLLKTK